MKEKSKGIHTITTAGHIRRGLALCMAAGLVVSVAVPASTPESLAKKSTAVVKLQKTSATLAIVQDKDKITYGKTQIKIVKSKGVKIKKTTYTSAKKKVAVVNKKGKVTAKKAGSAKIKVKVRYVYKNKTKTVTLTFKTKVVNRYKNILTALSLKRDTYVTFVGNGDGICPLYKTDVKKLPASFQVWDCVKMTSSNTSVATVGKEGLVIGKKAGNAEITISSTDGSKLAVKATVKVYATRDRIPESDDLYLSLEDDFLKDKKQGWTNFYEEADELYGDNRDALIKKYRNIEKQEDNTAEDALASLLSTAELMRDGNSDEAFFKTIQSKVIAKIKAAKTTEELLNCCAELDASGIGALMSTQGFGRITVNEDDMRAVLDGTMEAPDKPETVTRTYHAKVSVPWAPDLTMVAKRNQKYVKVYIRKLLVMAGEDTKGADDVSSLFFLMGEEKNETHMKLSEWKKRYQHLNLAKLLKKKGYDVTGDSEIFIDDQTALDVIDSCAASEKNLETLKLLTIAGVMRLLSSYTLQGVEAEYRAIIGPDINSMDKNDVKKEAEQELNRKIDEISGLIPWDMDEVYSKAYYGDAYKKQFEELTDRYIACYSDKIENCWMSQTAKKAMHEKLNRMKRYLLYPDEETYNRFEMPEDLITAAEGGSFADNYLKTLAYRAQLERMTVGTSEGDIGWWNPTTDVYKGQFPWTNMAGFYPYSNQIVIGHTLAANLFHYGKDAATDVDNIGFTATTIGHEIGHAFDTTGSNFNANGDLQNLWTDEDRATYARKVEKLKEYYQTLPVFADVKGGKAYYHNGKNVIGEAMADLGGTEIGLAVLIKTYPRDDEKIRRFFRASAIQWINTEDDDMDISAIYRAQVDVHPTGKARANGVASMMDEFCRVFDVTGGSAMFVSAKDRVEIWSQ